MVCNFCNSSESEVISNYTRLEKKNVLKCKNCGLVFLEMKKGKKEIESFYSSSHYRQISAMPVQSPEEHFNDKVTRLDAEDRFSFISKHNAVENKKIMEIGSASGSLLNKLKKNGAKDAIGIELDSEYSGFSKNRGLTVHTKPVEELDFKNEFDAIVSFHTMEHVYDPKETIKAIFKALKPRGIFLGEVPNQNDWRIQIFNNRVAKRFHYDPNHYYYFSPMTFKRYLEETGFKKIDLETVERYNSLMQLKNILCNWNSEENIEEILRKYIFPKHESDEMRLPDSREGKNQIFNKLFERGVNSDLMGNCLRWAAHKPSK
jgi:2-polyprenyl-3-methyl-5-hydroxy-6-metoxy-1,4-benzoquinol methylase